MTILGKHTISEVEELIGNVSNRVADVSAAYLKADKSKDKTLESDWPAWRTQWEAHKTHAQDRLAALKVLSPGIDNSNVPAEEQWIEILKAVIKGYPGQYTPKDLPGLQIRINAIQPIEWKEVEKNRVDAPDWDLDKYKKVDKVIKTGEKASGDFVKDNWGKFAVGGGLLLLGLIVYKKI